MLFKTSPGPLAVLFLLICLLSRHLAQGGGPVEDETGTSSAIAPAHPGPEPIFTAHPSTQPLKTIIDPGVRSHVALLIKDHVLTPMAQFYGLEQLLHVLREFKGRPGQGAMDRAIRTLIRLKAGPTMADAAYWPLEPDHERISTYLDTFPKLKKIGISHDTLDLMLRGSKVKDDPFLTPGQIAEIFARLQNARQNFTAGVAWADEDVAGFMAFLALVEDKNQRETLCQTIAPLLGPQVHGAAQEDLLEVFRNLPKTLTARDIAQAIGRLPQDLPWTCRYFYIQRLPLLAAHNLLTFAHNVKALYTPAVMRDGTASRIHPVLMELDAPTLETVVSWGARLTKADADSQAQVQMLAHILTLINGFGLEHFKGMARANVILLYAQLQNGKLNGEMIRQGAGQHAGYFSPHGMGRHKSSGQAAENIIDALGGSHVQACPNHRKNQNKKDRASLECCTIS